MIFVLDNYDSFTFNLVQYIGETGEEVQVRRNDQVTLEEIEEMAPRKIVLSPGPCTPNKAGISLDLIRHFAEKIPILGVSLGHPAICVAFGGVVIRSERIMHGKTSMVEHDGRTIFRGVSSPMIANRYHSLIVEQKSLPKQLEISAHSEENGKTVIMGLRHRELPVEGVQRQRERGRTPHGAGLLR